MGPTKPTTAAERKVIRWTFVSAAVAVVLYLAYAYVERRSECAALCRSEGSSTWELRMNSGGRFNLGTHCVCGVAGG